MATGVVHSLTNAAVVAHVRDVLTARGLSAERVEVLSPPGVGKKQARCTVRATLADGSAFKVRLLESVEAAVNLAHTRQRVGRPFTPVVAREGPVLLEPWIAGDELSMAQASERAGELGAILGRLHAIGIDGTRAASSSNPRRARAIAQLTGLAETGVITNEQCLRLVQELTGAQPADTRPAIVHLDYCPENLVVDSTGGLHVIDNEWMRIDAPGLDLGRTYARWPASGQVWRTFMRGYLATAPFDPGPLRFWMIVMAAASATVRLKSPARDASIARARLQALAEGSVE